MQLIGGFESSVWIWVSRWSLREAAGLSPYFEVRPTWSFHGAQIIPGSTTIQLPTHQTNPAIELGGWHWKGPSVLWGDDILLRNIWACCISCEGSQSIGNWWNKTTKTTWNHGFPGFPKKCVPSIYGIYRSKLGNLLQNVKYAGINTLFSMFFHVSQPQVHTSCWLIVSLVNFHCVYPLVICHIAMQNDQHVGGLEIPVSTVFE